MLRRIGRCRKKVMGLLRLMGNKADVVKGLAKRCNENWKVAPTSDIVRLLSLVCLLLVPGSRLLVGTVSLRHSRPFDHNDPKPEPLRENFVAHALELPRPDQHRDDRREQPDQRGALKAHRAGYDPHPDEPYHRYSSFSLSVKLIWLTNNERYLGHERTCTRPRRAGLRVVRLYRRSARDDRYCWWVLCI
jgi:hypothetical protein